jgi:hypothetical protein
MKPESSGLHLAVIIILLIVGYSPRALAAIERQINIDSTPKGADVFLLKGNKKTRLGKTPLTRNIKFHSAISEIRLLFEKQGLNPLTLKVKASDKKVSANLYRQSYTQDPGFHKNPHLRRLQSRINVDVDPLLVEIFQNKEHGFILSKPATLTGSKDKVNLIATLNDTIKIPGLMNTDRPEALKQLWSRLGRSVMLPLAKRVRSVKEVSTLTVQLIQNSKQDRLNVMPTTETKTVMQCVPGYRTQQVLRYRQVPQYESYRDKYGYHRRLTGYRSESYLDTEKVYEPCHQKVPVTQIVPTTTPKLDLAHSTHIEFSMNLNAYKPGMTNDQAYNHLSIIQSTPGSRKMLKAPNL